MVMSTSEAAVRQFLLCGEHQDVTAEKSKAKSSFLDNSSAGDM